jgi:transitional endoplasmic reticulum ATPase
MHSGSRSLMVGVAVAFVATFWLLYRRYHFVRRVAVFMLGLAAFHFLVQLDRPWLVAVAGCLMLALAMRVWYRRTHPLVRSTRNANAREGWRDSYFQAVYPRGGIASAPTAASNVCVGP